MESNVRSLLKAISYRVFGSATTAVVVYLLNGNLSVALGAGVLDAFAKMGLYFLHERLWNHISLGRPKPPEYEI
ncbi:MAG: DUF2061 domain-containing protein [Bryobacterales bacterium]|jgi:adenylylsulfate kinase|nr:DUF2061 domain-containing protein [Bryobacterales bacterium]